MSVRAFILTLPALALVMTPVHAGAGAGASYELEEGETNEGDLYLFSGVIRIDGEQNGDLMVFGQGLEVNGTVTGDVNAWTQKVELAGAISDTARLFAQSIRVTGQIHGDLYAFGQSVEIAPEAVITGRLNAGGAEVTIEGTIEGDAEATGGTVVMRGRIGGDAEFEADIIEIDPEARIEGNLEYISRNRLEIDEGEIVSGTVEWSPSRRQAKADVTFDGGWIVCLITALLVGLAALAIFSRQTAPIVSRVGGDGLRSAGIGFITAVVVPVAGLLACILIVTIPLVFIALLLFGLLVYLAKVPVAVWAGSLILTRLGRPSASPYVALLVGIPMLYLLFLIPYLGKLIWFACLFVGLGAIVLHIYDERQARRSPGGAAPVVPSTPPAPTGPAPTPQPT